MECNDGCLWNGILSLLEAPQNIVLTMSQIFILDNEVYISLSKAVYNNQEG